MGLLNVDGYYNSLLSFIDKAVEEGFISPSARHIIISAPTAEELVKKLEVFSTRKKSSLHSFFFPKSLIFFEMAKWFRILKCLQYLFSFLHNFITVGVCP